MNFRKSSKADLPAFQIAPMIDVVFLLLTFFMTSAVYSQWEREVDLVLPTATTGTVPDRLPGEIIINLRADGTISVNQQILTPVVLGERLRRLATLYPGQPVVVRADRSTLYEHLMSVMDTCRKADIWNISLATAGDDGAP